MAPKGGARFHLELPGSVQGFVAEQGFDSSGTLLIENVAGNSRRGNRCLALRYHHLAPGRFARAATAVFIPPDAAGYPPQRVMSSYNLVASPALYAGQTITAGISAADTNAVPVQCRLYVRAYDPDDKLHRINGPQIVLEPGRWEELSWRLDVTGGAPVAEVGIELSSDGGHEHSGGGDGTAFLDYLTWGGAPRLTLAQPGGGGSMWRRAWVDGVDRLETGASPHPYRLIQNQGTGLIIQGTRQWTNYRFSAAVTPHLVKAAGIGVRVQGMRRYYGLLLCADGRLRLVKALDGVTELANIAYAWEPGSTYRLSLQVVNTALQARVNDRLVEVAQLDGDLSGGGIALICEEGCMDASEVTVEPAGEGSVRTRST